MVQLKEDIVPPAWAGPAQPWRAKPGSPIRPSGAMRVPAAPPSPAGCRETRYSLAVRPNLNVPNSTAHEYRSFPWLLCLTHGSSKVVSAVLVKHKPSD